MMALNMNLEVRAQWCAALRSGEYPQTKQNLRVLPTEVESTGNCAGYCCLGVLTDLYLKAGHSEEFDDDESGWEFTVWNYDGILAPPVRTWAGLSESNPSVTVALSATDLNDGDATFAEIADLIDGGVS